MPPHVVEGIRVVARDSTEHVIGGLNRKTFSDGVEWLEARSLLEGIKLASEKGWHNIEVESNSQVVIKCYIF